MARWAIGPALSVLALLPETACRQSQTPVEPTELAIATEHVVTQGPTGTVGLWVEAGDLPVPLGFNLPIVSGQAKDSTILPVGPGRQLTLLRYGTDGTETHRSVARVDVKAGLNAPLVLSLEGHPGFSPIAVTLVMIGVTPAGSIKLSGAPAKLDSSGSFRLTATVYDDKGNPVKQPRIRYASIDPSRLTVDPLGSVRAVGNGLGHLVATAEGRASLPVAVLVSGFGWVSVSTGADITCGIRTGGFGYCWGDNAGGRMGSDPPVADSDRPLLIAGGLRFAQISAAQGQHSCGVTLSAELYCWGMNDHGQLGNGQTSSVRLPVRVSGGLSWARVTVGLAHTCGITTTGMAYCWGLNSQGQLGVGAPAGAELTVPTAVFSGQPYRSISAGPEHTCAINANGSALCWGSNGAGEVGHGTTGGIYTVPQLVQGLTAGVQELAAAEVATNCARTTTVVCWGGNTFGLMLEAQPISRNRPGPPLTISPVPSQVGLGIVYACALRPTGQPPLFGPQGPSEAICWGVFGNRAGIFNPPWSTQVRVVPRTYGLAQLRVGRVHACGITGTGHLLCWGGGQSGESTVRGGTPNSEPVEVP